MACKMVLGGVGQMVFLKAAAAQRELARLDAALECLPKLFFQHTLCPVAQDRATGPRVGACLCCGRSGWLPSPAGAGVVCFFSTTSFHSAPTVNTVR